MNLKKIVAFLILSVFFIPVSFVFAEDLKLEQGKNLLFDFVNAVSLYQSVDQGVITDNLIYVKENPGAQWYDKDIVFGNVNIGAGTKVVLDSAWEQVFISSETAYIKEFREVSEVDEQDPTHPITSTKTVRYDHYVTTYTYSNRERLATLSVASTGTIVLNNASELSIRNEYSLITSSGDISLRYRETLDDDDQTIYVVDHGNLTTNEALQYICRDDKNKQNVEGTSINMKVDKELYDVDQLFKGDIIFERGDSDTTLTFRGVSTDDVSEKPGIKTPYATNPWKDTEQTPSGGDIDYKDVIEIEGEAKPASSANDTITMRNNFIINSNRAVFNVETEWEQKPGSAWSTTDGGVALVAKSPLQSNISGDGTVVKKGVGVLNLLAADATDLTGAYTGYGWNIEEGMIVAKAQKNLGTSNIYIKNDGTLGLRGQIDPDTGEKILVTYINNMTLDGGEISIASNSDVKLTGKLSGEQAHFTFFKESRLILTGNNKDISNYLVTFGGDTGGYSNYLTTNVDGLANNSIIAENMSEDKYKESAFFQLNLNESRDIVYSGSLKGEMYLQKTGTGTVTLSGENTYTMGTYITEGGLLLATANSIGEGKIMFDGGTRGSSTTYASLGVSGDIKNVELQNDIHVKNGAILNVAENQTFNLSGSIENFDARPQFTTEIIKEGLGNVVIARKEDENRKINITSFTVNEGSFTLDNGVVLDSYFSLDGNNASLEMRQNAGVTNSIDIFNGDLTIFNENNISSAASIVFHSTATTKDSFSKLHITSDTVLSNETMTGKINITKNIEFITDATTTAKMERFVFGAGDNKVIVKSGDGKFIADNDSNDFVVSNLYLNGGDFRIENMNMTVSSETLVDGGVLSVSSTSHFASTADEKKITVLNGGIGIYDGNSIDQETELRFEGTDTENLSKLVIEKEDVVLSNSIYVKTGLIIENEKAFTFSGDSLTGEYGILAKAGKGIMTINSTGTFNMGELRSLEGNLLVKSNINVGNLSILGENAELTFDNVQNANIKETLSMGKGGTLILSTSTVNAKNINLASSNINIGKTSTLNSTTINFDSSTVNLVADSSVIKATTINLANNSIVKGFGNLDATINVTNGSSIHVGSDGTTGEKLKAKNIVFDSGSNLYVDVSSENGVVTTDILEVAGDITVHKDSTLYVNLMGNDLEYNASPKADFAEGDSDSAKEFKFLTFTGNYSFDNTTNEIFNIVLSDPRFSASTALIEKSIFLILAQEWSVYDIPGTTKNQQSMIDVFNKIYADDKTKESMKSVLSTLDAIYSTYRTTGDKAQFINALQDLSGIFYANSFMTSAMLSKANIIYSRLNDFSKEREENSNLWAQVYTNSFNVAENEENPKFENSIYGMIAGYDTVAEDNLVFGIAGFYGQGELKQLDDKADVMDAGVNVYGDYKVNENIDVQGLLGYSIQDYDTTRNLRFIKQEIKSKYATNTISLDLQAAYRYDLNEKLSLKPLIGANCAIVSNGDIEEDGNTDQKLKINKNSYTKADVRLGVGLQSRAVSPFNWYISAVVKQIVVGDKFTTKSSFAKASEYEFEIESTKLASTSFAGNLGCAYDISSSFNVSLDLNADTGSASGFGANIGATYRW